MNRKVTTQRALPGCNRPGAPDGFALVELLVVMGIIGVLAGMLLAALSRGKAAGRRIQCLSQMRQIGLATRLYADENRDELPRSQHTAFSSGQSAWGKAIAEQLGQSTLTWTNLFKTLYRCPSDRRAEPWSYGQNVYFELDPSNDDYTGSPVTWRRASFVPHPSRTILQAETPGAVDHVMPHFWILPSDAGDVDQQRHHGRANYNFVDGHAKAMQFQTTFDPSRHVDAWNPILAN